MTTRSIPQVLLRRWRVIATVTLVCIVAALLAANAIPPKYTASTSLVVAPIAADPFGSGGEEVNIRTEREVLGSSEVAANKGAGSWLNSTDPELSQWYLDAAGELRAVTSEDVRRTLDPGRIQPKGPERPDFLASGEAAMSTATWRRRRHPQDNNSTDNNPEDNNNEQPDDSPPRRPGPSN